MERFIALEDFAFDPRYLHSLGLQRLRRDQEKGPGTVYLTLLLFTPSGIDRTNWRSSHKGDEGTVAGYLNVLSSLGVAEEEMNEIAEAVTATWLTPLPEHLPGQLPRTDQATGDPGQSDQPQRQT